MKAKHIKIMDDDYHFLINSFILLDGQSLANAIPKSYHIVKIEETEASKTIFLSKEE